jgi:putative salt-induced outer membrane protein
VATEGFEREQKPAEDKDATELTLAGGGQFAAGNTQSAAFTSAAQFRLRRGNDQLSAAAAGNLSQAAPEGSEDLDTTAQNVQGKIRYDRFLVERLAVFLGVSARNDPFQGLDLRMNVDPGVAYYFIDAEKHQLWGELGYDLQHDIRRQENIDAAPEPLSKTETRHSGRVFAGYGNKINAAVTFTTGLEYIQSVQSTENWRLNWNAGLTSQIVDRFAAATTFSLQHDNNPLPDVKKTDVVTAVSLVLTIL